MAASLVTTAQALVHLCGRQWQNVGGSLQNRSGTCQCLPGLHKTALRTTSISSPAACWRAFWSPADFLLFKLLMFPTYNLWCRLGDVVLRCSDDVRPTPSHTGGKRTNFFRRTQPTSLPFPKRTPLRKHLLPPASRDGSIYLQR